MQERLSHLLGPTHSQTQDDCEAFDANGIRFLTPRSGNEPDTILARIPGRREGISNKGMPRGEESPPGPGQGRLPGTVSHIRCWYLLMPCGSCTATSPGLSCVARRAKDDRDDSHRLCRRG
jgi:hypothetical protein